MSLTKMRNNCYCKRKKGVIYLEQDCPARYTHNGRKWLLIDLEAFARDRGAEMTRAVDKTIYEDF